MAQHDDRNTLLVVVATRSQATAVEIALSARRIAARVHQDVARVIEFGGKLGVHPFEVYVSHEDLVRAREVIAAEELPRDGRGPDLRSALGM